eukprot:TRINITY_DN5217_c0_g2_i1.p2 TRINITY_DN5217_c0_g2~~TRINITY_DN5217_c0_g2_i1.p2  ORF type:complete len:159 (-),score=38.54 TRINITY_DN5217_c0_g2_i1:14-490(-)
MPRDKNTTSLGKARGGPQRITRLDHREVVVRPDGGFEGQEGIDTPPDNGMDDLEEEARRGKSKEEVSVTSSDEGASESSDEESSESDKKKPKSTVSVPEVNSQFGGGIIMANVISEEELRQLKPTEDAKTSKSGSATKAKASPKPKTPKTTPVRVCDR